MRPRLISTRSVWPPLIGAAPAGESDALVLGCTAGADTAAIARNAFEAGLPLWLPQVDWGGASSGFAETDPPLYSCRGPAMAGLACRNGWPAA